MKPIKLRDEFVQSFAGTDVTTRQVLEWYNQRALMLGNKPTTYRSNLYISILHPLIMEGRVVKLTHGLFHVLEEKEVGREEDEFDRYLQSKIEQSLKDDNEGRCNHEQD